MTLKLEKPGTRSNIGVRVQVNDLHAEAGCGKWACLTELAVLCLSMRPRINEPWFILALTFAVERPCRAHLLHLSSLRRSSNPSCRYIERRLPAVQIGLRGVLQSGLACSAPRSSFHFLSSQFEWE